MGEANEKQEQRFSQEQYDMLKRCSKKKDMTEWNEWRYENRGIEILLGGAHFRGAYLEGANLFRVNLKGASLYEANLKNADLRLANLENADLFGANLEDANLMKAHMRDARLSNSCLRRANLSIAYLENAILTSANMKEASLSGANLDGTDLSNSSLQGTTFEMATVTASTFLWKCAVDKCTDFRNVNLDMACVEPGIRELLKYNRRRMSWNKWYEVHGFWGWPIRFFWWISDYGRSTSRIVAAFFILAFSFALIYYVWGAVDYYVRGVTDQPGIVYNLFVDEQGQVPDWLVPFRAIYFSIVTMTTLGFGDMYAHGQCFFGHLLLVVQVILGYVILGLLIQHFSVLLRSDGPTAGKFADKEEKEVTEDRIQR